MTYTDTLFIFLFSIIFIAGRCLRPRPIIWEWFITGFSALVIASWGLFGLALFLAIVTVNYAAVLAMCHAGPTGSRAVLVTTIAADIAVLAIFKYSNFFGRNFTALLGWQIPDLPLDIPLAISFYTFHLISYLVDVHAGSVANTSFRRYLYYLIFFPHLIAGPIVRAWQFIPQIGHRRRVRTDVMMGVHYLAVGFFLKSVAADNIAGGIDPIWTGQGMAGLTGLDHWLVAFLYYCQIYGDFAGYTLIALGMARLLGYRLPPNFRSPMLAASLREFWRRWHITLSRWLRDYLYIPLGGSRGTPARTYLSILVTMLLGGLWHGAGWGFIIWGAMHGIGLIGERVLYNPAYQNRWAGWIVAQLWVTVAWVFFRAPDLPTAWSFLTGMARFGSWAEFGASPRVTGLLIFAIPVIAHHCAPLFLRTIPRRHLAIALGLSTGFLLAADLLVWSPSKTFIYFRF